MWVFFFYRCSSICSEGLLAKRSFYLISSLFFFFTILMLLSVLTSVNAVCTSHSRSHAWGLTVKSQHQPRVQDLLSPPLAKFLLSHQIPSLHIHFYQDYTLSFTDCTFIFTQTTYSFLPRLHIFFLPRLHIYFYPDYTFFTHTTHSFFHRLHTRIYHRPHIHFYTEFTFLHRLHISFFKQIPFCTILLRLFFLSCSL